MDDEESGGLVPPGPGPAGQSSFIKRRPEPLWIVALVITLPLIILLVIFVVRASGLF